MTDVSVALNPSYDRAGLELVAVKLSTPGWEFNFWAAPEELARLGAIRDANWLARRCLRIGESAGAPVYWATEGATVTIMVGHDPETWDIALVIPAGTVDQIVTDAADDSWRRL
jgi:hypothetical protein